MLHMLVFIFFVFCVYGTDESTTCTTNKTTYDDFILINLIENENSNEFFNNITYDITLKSDYTGSYSSNEFFNNITYDITLKSDYTGSYSSNLTEYNNFIITYGID